MTLIYGRDERAIEAAKLLEGPSRRHRADHAARSDIAPPRVTEFPVVKGTIRSAKGHLGAFELIVDDYAAPAPSSRGALSFGAGAQRRGVALRHRARSLRRRAAVSRARSARRLSARRSRRSGRRAARRAQGARSRRHLRQAALHHISPKTSARIRARRSSAAAAASISARPARSRPPAIMWRSIRTSAPAAANAPPSARPAPPPTRCRPPTR